MEQQPLNLQQLLQWQPPIVQEIISGGVLHPQTRLFIYGQYGLWKSMTTLDLGFKIATGLPWWGFSTTKSSVLIVQMEIPKYLLRERAKKYAEGNNLYPNNIYFLTAPYLKLDKGFGVAYIDKILKVFHPDILILDPMYKLLTGHIVDSYDVDRLHDNLDTLIVHNQCSLITIAHRRQPNITPTGEVIHRGAEEAMGSSHIPNWYDTIVEIISLEPNNPQPTNIEYRFEKVRHALEELKPIKVRIDRSTLKFTMK